MRYKVATFSISMTIQTEPVARDSKRVSDKLTMNNQSAKFASEGLPDAMLLSAAEDALRFKYIG